MVLGVSLFVFRLNAVGICLLTVFGFLLRWVCTLALLLVIRACVIYFVPWFWVLLDSLLVLVVVIDVIKCLLFGLRVLVVVDC